MSKHASSSSVAEQNALLSQLLSLSSKHSVQEPLVTISDQVSAGRGLVLTRRIDPEQQLLKLPADTLINVKSYSSFFHPDTLPRPATIAAGVKKSLKECRLSSAVLLSVLVARARVEGAVQSKRGGEPSTKHRALQLFVRTLPTSFDTVPLTWSLIARPIDTDDTVKTWKRLFFTTLLDALPPHSRTLHRKVRDRFERDWSRFHSLRAQSPELLAEPSLLASNPNLALSTIRSIDVDTFLWAWLCVNSRCLYLPLGLADHGDNFTLAPLLDMANHTSDPALESKVRYATDGGFELHAPTAAQSEGDECCITYGPHSNAVLLSEYGFVLPAQLTDAQEGWRGNRYTDVLVDEVVDQVLASQGEEGEVKKEMLQNRGYWGDFTLHAWPAPAHPSYRLIPALRLAAIQLRSEATKLAKVKPHAVVKAGKKVSVQQNVPTELDKWEETLTGYRDMVSEENEVKARSVLVEICSERRKGTQDARRHAVVAEAILGEHEADTETDGPGLDACKLSLAFVKQLLDEEEGVLELVAQAARDGDEW